MLDTDLKEFVTTRILPNVQTPAQYVGGEMHSVRKDHRQCRGTVCLAFPDTYAMGMSHHGLQVLYSLMNEQGWACERAFTPLPDFEAALRDHGLPLYSLETFTPLNRFDVLGFTLQYEICYTNVLTMLDMGGIPLHAEDRGPDDTLVIAGGPGAQNPELIAPFIDLFVLGDGEPSLPHVCELWKSNGGLRPLSRGEAGADRRRRQLGLRPPFLPADLQRGRYPGRDRPHPRRRAGEHSGLHLDRPRHRHPAHEADRADGPGGAGADRHRDHARLPLAVPLLPEHDDQAPAALSQGRDDRPGRPGDVPQHRLRRDQPALALVERLPPLRGTGDPHERGLHAARGEASRCRACGSPRCSRRSRRCCRRAAEAG